MTNIDRWTQCAVVPVVLAGNEETRIWPALRSGPSTPLNLVSDETALAPTLRRLSPNSRLAARYAMAGAQIVCGDANRFDTAQRVVASGLDARMVVQPACRDTAPAFTLAAALAEHEHGDALLVAMPADHAIHDTAAFDEAIGRALHYAQRGCVAMLGIRPEDADHRHGYLRVADTFDIDGESAGKRIETFIDKPEPELAGRYVESGRYWLHSGVFVVRASVWLRAIEALAPEMFSACLAAVGDGMDVGAFFYPHAKEYAASPSDSIEYAVLERLVKYGNECEEAPEAVAVLLAHAEERVAS
jgi:mannose-1-phosphate guanylyltransferase / mannose-6-phosphate isomerase